MTTVPSITSDELKAARLEPFQRGKSRSHADLYALTWQNQPGLLKDFSNRPWWLRVFWARPLLAREARMMELLNGLPGVPRLLARVGRDGILIERLDARSMPRRSESRPPLEYFERATELVKALHKRGLSHGDLHRTNLLIDDKGNPYLIDFTTSLTNDTGRWAFVSRYLFRRGAQADLSKMAQMKACYYPTNLTAEEAHALANPPLALVIGRFFKRNVYRYKKQRHRQRLYRRMLNFFGSPTATRAGDPPL